MISQLLRNQGPHSRPDKKGKRGSVASDAEKLVKPISTVSATRARMCTCVCMCVCACVCYVFVHACVICTQKKSVQ